MASTTVNFNLKTAGNVNFANQTLTFTLLSAGAIGTGDFIALPSSVSATSDEDGDGSVVLFRNGDSSILSVYEVLFPSRERFQFLIPAGTSTIELSNLIVNEQPSGATTQQSSVYAEAIKRANHTGTQLLSTISDGTEGVQDIVGGMVTGNTETGIAVTYEDSDGTLDFVVASQTDENFTTADHAKLDGIETSATADQTNAEIRAAVEAATDSNVFTDADHTKLNGIEASATTDQTASEIRALVESATDSNVFTDADHSKLNAIEASADVTDTANVTSAGALMDSEVDADIKTLSLPASTTISALGKTIVGGANAAAVRSTLEIADSAAVSNFVPRSITFTNTSAYLSLADNNALDVDAGDFSLSFWARLDSSGTEPVLTKLSGTGYRLKFVSGSLILTMQDSGGSADFTLATGLADSKWHVYVVTVDRSGNAIAYVDNVAQTGVGVSGTASTLANSGQFQIGSDGGSNAGDGIALGNYIALHKAVLTASQAAQIYFSADAAFTAVAPTLMVDLRKADKTFTDVSASGLAVTTNGTIIFNEGRITSLDGATIGATTPAAATGTNVLATTTLGYKAGSGGTVTQASNKTTAVTLNKINGEIVMNGAALADDATAAFTLTNSTIAATDVVIVNVASVGTAGAYQVTVGAVAAGSCSISVLNVSGGSLSEAIKLNFLVIKAVKA